MSDKVEAFLDLVHAVHRGLISRFGEDGEEGYLPEQDVVWKIANYIDSDGYGKNGPRNNSSAPSANTSTAAGSTKTVTGPLQKKKADTNTAGKQQYSIQLNGEWYNTLQASAFGGVKFSEGQEVVAEVKSNLGKNGKVYWNLIKLSPAGDDGVGPEIPF